MNMLSQQLELTPSEVRNLQKQFKDLFFFSFRDEDEICHLRREHEPSTEQSACSPVGCFMIVQ